MTSLHLDVADDGHWTLAATFPAVIDLTDPDARRQLADVLTEAEHILERHPDKFAPTAGPDGLAPAVGDQSDTFSPGPGVPTPAASGPGDALDEIAPGSDGGGARGPEPGATTGGASQASGSSPLPAPDDPAAYPAAVIPDTTTPTAEVA